MMKKIVFLSVLLISSGLFAKTPQWVKNPSKEYPAQDFFSAVGTGKDQQQAELKAVENLAAVFGRNVNSFARTSSRMRKAEADGTVRTGKTSDFSQDITQRVAVEDLIGIELKEYYCDDGKHYALAVMDKKQTQEILLSSITSNNSRIEKLLCTAKPSELYTLENYARFDFAREIAELDEKMLSKLEVINVSCAEPLKKKIYTAASVRSQMLDIARAIPIGIKITGEGHEKMFQAVSEMFGQYGFRVSDSDGTRYTFFAKTERLQRESDDGKTFQCIYSFDGQLMDRNEMEYLWSTSFKGRASSGDENLLSSKTDRAMASKIKEETTMDFGRFLGDMRAE